MEGMISRELIMTQDTYQVRTGDGIDTERWAKGIVIKLLEVTHGQ